MKIRTRLLLFLLPTLISSIAIVSTLLSINWYKEIVDGFRTKLKSSVISTASNPPSEKHLEEIRELLQLSHLYFLPIQSAEIESIPKTVHITPIYTSKEGHRLMSGYAPVFDSQQHIRGLMAADIHVNLIDKKFHESLFLILLCAGLTILIVVLTLFFIANKISKPVQRLNNSALAIAAGQYGDSLKLQGPKEIAELANTLNTMSECLFENINRLKENSLRRERLYGEYESAMLLQHLMLQKNIDECHSDAIAVKPITFFSESPRGLLLDFPKTEDPNLFYIHLAEAEEEGFEGMYQLLTQYKLSKGPVGSDATSLTLDKLSSSVHVKGGQIPLFWSLESQQFLEVNQGIVHVDAGDYIFFLNRGFLRFFRGEKRSLDVLSRVLKVFSSDGLETTVSMLQKEILFHTKRKTLPEDIHLLCFQVLSLSK